MPTIQSPADVPTRQLDFDRRSILVGMGVAASLSGATWGAPLSKATPVSRRFSIPRHTTHYLESGPADGPLMMFLHGWPELSLMWRAQIEAFAAEGWRCVAPDMRGYGGSSAPAANSAYTNEQVVADMAGAARPSRRQARDLGRSRLGQRHRRRAGFTSAPTQPRRRVRLSSLLPRRERPADARSAGGSHDLPSRPVSGRPVGLLPLLHEALRFPPSPTSMRTSAASLASIFKPADPSAMGKPSPNASVTSKGGRFGAAHRAPPSKPDPAIWPPADFDALVRAFGVHGFRPPCAWYLNDDANVAYMHKAPNGGRISLPALYVNGEYDQVNTINGNHYGDAMRAACSDLTVKGDTRRTLVAAGEEGGACRGDPHMAPRQATRLIKVRC